MGRRNQGILSIGILAINPELTMTLMRLTAINPELTGSNTINRD